VTLESRRKHTFHQESGCGWRKDEARPMVTACALCYLQCFDTDGWLEERTSGPQKPVSLISEVLFWIGRTRTGGEPAAPGSEVVVHNSHLWLVTCWSHTGAECCQREECNLVRSLFPPPYQQSEPRAACNPIKQSTCLHLTQNDNAININGEYARLDWLIQLRFYVSLHTKWVISETYFLSSLLA